MSETRPKPAADDPLAILQVFDRLEVGPVKVEPRRLVAPYRVWQHGKKDSIDLIYRYEEKVFDPDEAASQNLAHMIAAQVALNYGLFCRSIVFHGPFDSADRRFLQEMADNTAREIYVKKFLEPNVFLVGDVAHLPVVRQSHYSRADMEFPDASVSSGPWSMDRNRHAILSSGGKDSLLSHGLIQEIGHESHPIYLNESGRHWFTALNAYRHFKDHVPNTARVWVNSDRVFNWVLRHLPFIRPDFANIRSDEYPIRLWTVAVFLFGAIPLMRKRGMARLLIGNEFDTSWRSSYKGIPHYNGTYDQSPSFDNAMSRYYTKKGWSISQFSILRPLSELLIEKILARRYPDLQEQQVSCHATHKQDGRVHPCGRCEKCRRIVGMLVAIGVSPTRCGYSSEQIRDCLDDLVHVKLHQEAPGVSQLLHMLREGGHIALDKKATGVKEHLEILKIRFDEAHSRPDAIPVDLRLPLYRIYLEYAGGALHKKNGRWADIDPLTDPVLAHEYPFEPVNHDHR